MRQTRWPVCVSTHGLGGSSRAGELDWAGVVKGGAARASTASDENVKRAMRASPVDSTGSVEGGDESKYF